MSKDIVIPELDGEIESVTLAEWHVKVGDKVNVGDVIAEIESDKVSIDLEAQTDGVISEILQEADGEAVAPGTIVARFV